MARVPAAKKSEDVEVEVTLMRRVGPERFEVITAVVKGQLSGVKVLERNVSIVVGRLTAQRAMRAQTDKAIAKLGLSVGN